MNYTKINQNGLLRDNNSHAIININDSEYHRILEQRSQYKQTQAIQNQVNDLKNEFLEIKEMLKKALSGTA